MSISIPDNEENVKISPALPVPPTEDKETLVTLFSVLGERRKKKSRLLVAFALLCPVFVKYGLKKTYLLRVRQSQ